MARFHWFAACAALCFATPAQAGIDCADPEFKWEVTASGPKADRDVVVQLTTAALLHGRRYASVAVADERKREEPRKGSCLAEARVNVARSASGVTVELVVREFRRVGWDAARHVGTGPTVVLALEQALAAAEIRSAGATPLVALLPPPPCEATAPRAVRALLVGINEYAKGPFEPLRGAVRDTSLVGGAILSRYADASITKLHDRAATREGLHAALTALVEATRCGDVVFIHYSGWATLGGADGSDDLEPWDARRVALVLSDQKRMGESALRGFVTALRNRRAFVVVVLDTKDTAGVDLGSSWRRSAEEGVELARGSGDLAVMTAGLMAWEYSFEDGPAGVFSLAVALAIQKEGGLSMRSLALAVEDNVSQLVKQMGRKSTGGALGWRSAPDVFALIEDLSKRARDRGVSQQAIFQPFFEATNPDARLLPGPSRTPPLDVRLDREREARGVALLDAPSVGRNVVIAGTVAEADRLSGLLVNGKKAELGPGDRFRVELELRPGLQKIEFVGVRHDLSLPTAAREVQVGAVGDTPSGQSYALLIGIEKYDKWSNLETPIADVRDVARILRERYGFATALPSFGDLVLENADRNRIGNAFNALRKALGPNDSLIVYYAGHGKGEGPKERRRGFWIPRDADQENRATWYSGQDLLGEIADMRARHILVVSDSCFSGDLTRDLPNPAKDVSDAERRRLLNERSGRPSRILITSGYDEPVLDRGGGGHSVFARAFIDGLEKIADERFLSFDLFSRFIYQQVGGKSPQQPHHVFLADSGHDGGDMPFVRRGAMGGQRPAGKAPASPRR